MTLRKLMGTMVAAALALCVAGGPAAAKPPCTSGEAHVNLDPNGDGRPEDPAVCLLGAQYAGYHRRCGYAEARVDLDADDDARGIYNPSGYGDTAVCVGGTR